MASMQPTFTLTSYRRLVTVQLPIVLIHMVSSLSLDVCLLRAKLRQNSLDVVPNSVAQVTMAIEEKRTTHTCQGGHSPPPTGHKRSQSLQGRAFAARRMQSLGRMRAHARDLQKVGEIPDRRPRKHAIRRVETDWDYHTPPSNRKGRVV